MELECFQSSMRLRMSVMAGNGAHQKDSETWPFVSIKNHGIMYEFLAIFTSFSV